MTPLKDVARFYCLAYSLTVWQAHFGCYETLFGCLQIAFLNNAAHSSFWSGAISLDSRKWWGIWLADLKDLCYSNYPSAALVACNGSEAQTLSRKAYQAPDQDLMLEKVASLHT